MSVSLQQRILLTAEPIQFSFAVQLLIGTEKDYHKLLKSPTVPKKMNSPLCKCPQRPLIAEPLVDIIHQILSIALADKILIILLKASIDGRIVSIIMLCQHYKKCKPLKMFAADKLYTINEVNLCYKNGCRIYMDIVTGEKLSSI